MILAAALRRLDLFRELKRLSFVPLLFAASSLAVVTSYFNPLLLKQAHPWTVLVQTLHQDLYANRLAGSQAQRRLIPELAQGLSVVLDHDPLSKRFFRAYYGQNHQIPSIIFAYILIHWVTFMVGSLGIYTFVRRVLGCDPWMALVGALGFIFFESFALTGFVTGRWTDPSAPVFFVWLFLFWSERRWGAYLLLFLVFSVVREVALFFLIFPWILWTFEQGRASVSGFLTSSAARVWAGSVLIFVLIRGALFLTFPGYGYTDNSASVWGSLVNGIAMNFHDSNAFKFPLAQHNFLLLTAWLGWASKPPLVRAIACMAPIIYFVHMGFGSVGESYGRDLPASLCLWISTLEWMKRTYEREKLTDGF